MTRRTFFRVLGVTLLLFLRRLPKTNAERREREIDRKRALVMR